MKLSIQQKSKIRLFAFYLVNGTLDFKLLNEKLSQPYYEMITANPQIFYEVCCVFINQEIQLNPNWPKTTRLAEYICKTLEPNRFTEISPFEGWELDFEHGNSDIKSKFKEFSKWFTEYEVVEGASYSNYIENGASFVEQCFAIWANVVEFEEKQVQNQEHAINRVKTYMKSYYGAEMDENQSKLEDWECELHMK